MATATNNLEETLKENVYSRVLPVALQFIQVHKLYFSQNIHLCFSQFGFLINRLPKPRFKCKFCKQVNQDSQFLLNREKKLKQEVLCKAQEMDKGTSLHCYHWPYLTKAKIGSTAIRPALPDLPCQYKLSQQHTKINSHFPPILFSELGFFWTCQGQNHAYAIKSTSSSDAQL